MIGETELRMAPPGRLPEADISVLGGYAVETQVGFLLRRAHQRHAAIFLEAMAAQDLTPTQFTALIKVVEHGHVTQNLLGRMVATDPATIQGVVRRLTARGLIRRQKDPMDRRTAVLVPTEAGLEAARRAVGVARDITEATLLPLAGEERRIFLALLRRLV
jgi:DNA-binding MarR family transcriptional regulator